MSAAALPCVCFCSDEECVCSDDERWARHLADGSPACPLDETTRQCWAREAARVEGYPPATSNLTLDDRDLARLWLESMVDYARDHGLIP